MYETHMPQREKRHTFAGTVTSIPGTIDAGMPTLEKRMNRYFDQYMPAVIEEWGVVTLPALEHLERRLDLVSLDIQVLEQGRIVLKERARAVEKGLAELEKEEEGTEQ